MTTYATSAGIVHAINLAGYSLYFTRCNVTLPKAVRRVKPISHRNGATFAQADGAPCKICFAYTSKDKPAPAPAPGGE